MPHWLIHDRFASIPECEGKVALAVAFAQFVAVECDQDPLDEVELAINMAEASSVQQLLRWFVRLLQSGKLRSYARPIGGGPVTSIQPVHWHADDLVARFITSQYSRAHPFDASAQPDSWLFVDGDTLQDLWTANRKAFLQATGQIPQPRRSTDSRARVSNPQIGLGSNGALLSLPEVEEFVGLKRSTIYKLVEEGRFPSQIRVGGRALWRKLEIEDWIVKLEKPST